MMYPEKPPSRVKKSVSFGTTEPQNDEEQYDLNDTTNDVETSPSSSSPVSNHISNDDNDNEQSSQIVDSSKNTDNHGNNVEEANTNNGDSTLEVPRVSQRKLRRRSLLMRMVEEDSDCLPPRQSMLKSQRIELGDDFNLSSDEEDDDEEKKKSSSSRHFNSTSVDMEQASKPKQSANEFSFKKFKHLPDIVVTPTKDTSDAINRRYLTEEEIRKLHMSEDDLIKKSLVMSNCMKSIGVVLLILFFGFTAVGIGYKIGQKE